MPPTLIEPLSCIVRNKTGGVILFVTNFLKSLHEERLIYFNLTTLRWEFDLDRIMHKEISNDIIEFLSERIKRLPRSIQVGRKFSPNNSVVHIPISPFVAINSDGSQGRSMSRFYV
jgi:hypothetical protein